MIKKLKLGLLVAVLSLAMASSVNAADLNFSVNTNVTMGGNTYVIVTGSAATSMILATNGLSLDVVVPTGSTFTLVSPDRHTLTTVGGTVVCTNTESTLTIAGLDATTRTITPSTAACGAITGGGGGGGGTVPPGDTTPPSSTSVSINAGASTTASLTSTLTLAATDATQMLISNDAGFAGALWETYATSKSWMLVSGDGTKTVYVKFRDAAGNMSVATSDMITVSGSGTVAVVVTNPAPTDGCSGGNVYNTTTGALCVNNTANPSLQIPGCGNRTDGFSTVSGGSCVGNRVSSIWYNFGTVTLRNGSRGEAVKELQRFLNAKLFLGLVVDGMLGPKTIAVIKKWQMDNGLVADGLVGAKTKAKMNASVQ